MGQETSTLIPAVKAKLLEGKRGLIVGIANDQSIAWGCAKAFRALGAEIAVTYLNDKAKKFVEPLARELKAPILMPLDVRVHGRLDCALARHRGRSGLTLQSRPSCGSSCLR
jgi:enoyl-[acyl-carrier protein] reductase I